MSMDINDVDVTENTSHPGGLRLLTSYSERMSLIPLGYAPWPGDKPIYILMIRERRRHYMFAA